MKDLFADNIHLTYSLEQNMELGEALVALRQETQQSYEEATDAYKRWDEIEKQLKDIDYVSLIVLVLSI